MQVTLNDPSQSQAPAQRLLSLDVLRGITIAFMIMVNNNGGSGSWGFMNHAQWNGLTPTDLVFPTFVFVVGASIAYAFEARLARGATRAELAGHTVKRAAILFLLGVVVNGFPFFELAHLRIYGVLQRIALCYLLIGLFYLWDKRVWTKVAALVAALAGYWILLRWVPVPVAGMPGRDIPFMDQSLNLVSWIDRHLMPHRLYLEWPGPGVMDPHNLHDPEGLLSTLPALGTTLLGLLTGLWLRTRKQLVDQFLCAGGGRLVADRARAGFLGCRRAWLAKALDLALAGAGIKRHCSLHVQRTGHERPGYHSFHSRRTADECAGLGLHPRLRAHSRPRLGRVCLLGFDPRILFYSGLGALPQKDLHQGVKGLSP